MTLAKGNNKMIRKLRNIVLAAALGITSLVAVPTVTKADDYWDGYWGWYDGSYRPYYSRRYYSSPSYYDGYYGSPYGGYYGGNPYGGYYGRRYRGNYYGTQNYGYRDFRGGGGQVNIGGLRFGWR
jgi:hypothetical protein